MLARYSAFSYADLCFPSVRLSISYKHLQANVEVPIVEDAPPAPELDSVLALFSVVVTLRVGLPVDGYTTPLE